MQDGCAENKTVKKQTKNKSFSDFILMNVQCPSCSCRISLLDISDSKCPKCDAVLAVSETYIKRAKEAESERIIKAEKKKQERELNTEKTGPSVEVGSFVTVDKGNGVYEYMIVEKEKGVLKGLRVIDKSHVANGEYVQSAYANKVVIISSKATGISKKKILSIKARLPIQHLTVILNKYRDYVSNQKYKSERRKNMTSKRTSDGLYNGGSWEGLSMTNQYIKIYRG